MSPTGHPTTDHPTTDHPTTDHSSTDHLTTNQGVNCISYLDMLQKIFSYMKKNFLIDSHVKILGRNYRYAHFWQKLLLFLQGVKDGGYSFYTNVYRRCTAHMPLVPPRGKAPLSFMSCGFSSSPPSSLRRQFC